jgi:hypothetical protein
MLEPRPTLSLFAACCTTLATSMTACGNDTSGDETGSGNAGGESPSGQPGTPCTSAHICAGFMCDQGLTKLCSMGYCADEEATCSVNDGTMTNAGTATSTSTGSGTGS